MGRRAESAACRPSPSIPYISNLRQIGLAKDYSYSTRIEQHLVRDGLGCVQHQSSRGSFLGHKQNHDTTTSRATLVTASVRGRAQRETDVHVDDCDWNHAMSMTLTERKQSAQAAACMYVNE